MKQPLYPLRFFPIFKERIWGGQKLQTVLHKNLDGLTQCGESWEISGLKGNVSVVSNGALAGKNLNELLETYGEALVGKQVYKRFGNRFPLLIKFLDAADDLSVQVHPDDKLAMRRHQTWGKSEMWYVLHADSGARVACGFKKPVTRMSYLQSLQNNMVDHLLNYVETKPGDVFYIPPGRVHSIGEGVVLAEVQQTSDLTYRIYDFNRKDREGLTRQLHTHQALDVIDFGNENGYQKKVKLDINKIHELVHCSRFKTNLVKFDKPLECDLSARDSFIIYMVVEGACELKTEGFTEQLQLGDSLLIPATFNKLEFKPIDGLTKVMGVYVE